MKRTPGGDFAGTAMNELVFLWSVICAGVALFAAPSDGQTQAEAGRSDERAVLVGTDDGVYRLRGRVDGDLVWRTEGVYRTEGRSVRGLAVDPESSTLVVGFGMRGAGMVMSPDAGDSWTRVPLWPDERQAWSIAFDRRGRVLAGSQPADIWHADRLTGEWLVNQSVQAIPERKDWTFIRPPYEAHIVTLARDPKSPQRWLAAVEQGGVLASEDDGRTWRQCSPLWDTHVVVFLPEGAIVAATAGGLQVSADGARSWQSAEQPRGYGTGLSIDADGIVYAVVKGADHGPIWYSKDAGRTWEPAPDGATLPHPDFGVHALAADPLIAGTLYYGAGDAVWLLGARTARKIAEGLPPIRRVLVLTTSPTPERPSSGESESSMKTLQPVRHISVSINRPPDQVFAFVSNPENLPKWATGLGGSIKNVNGEWIADAPTGEVKIRFAKSNTFGVLDHDVILKSGVRIHNPMRVVPNGSGSEIVFTLFRQSDMSDEKFSDDSKWVEKDLRILKDLLEK